MSDYTWADVDGERYWNSPLSPEDEVQMALEDGADEAELADQYIADAFEAEQVVRSIQADINRLKEELHDADDSYRRAKHLYEALTNEEW